MGRKVLKMRRTQQIHTASPHPGVRDTDKLDADKHRLTEEDQTKSHSDRKKRFTKPEKECSVKKDKITTHDIFPRWLPWLLFPLTLSFRILYVLEPTNWWILHPDEIFQTIEVAHSDMFGYGFRPYEYLPPPGNNVFNSTTLSAAHAQKIKLGMYSLRSFILPKLLSSVMLLANTSGINASPYLVIKIFHVILTSLLPVIIFQFSRKLYLSRDIGCLSALLVSSSLTLNVFGTHTIINSFLSPFLFLSLVPLLNLLQSVEQKHNTKSKELHSSDAISNSDTDTEMQEQTTKHSSEKIVRNAETAHKQSNELNGSISEQSKSRFSSHDENANIIFLQGKFSNLHALNCCGLENGGALYSIANGYRSKLHIEVPKCTGSLNILNISEAFAAIGLALCIYIRADLIIIPLLVMFCYYDHVLRNVSKFLTSVRSYLFGFVTGVLIGGYCDYVMYGRWFLSPYQWYKFNVWNSFAGRIFGVNSWSFYVFKLYQNEPLVMLSCILLLVDLALCFGSRNALKTKAHSHSTKNQTFAIFVLLLLAFSLNNHKELRFMHDAIIFMYIAVARALFLIHEKIKIFLSNQKSRQYSIYSVYIFIVLFISSHYFYFVNMKFEERAKWTYARTIDSHETNICLNFIRQQKDVRGVFMDRSIHMSGVYSILHRDVPIFALNMFEFMEYKQALHSSVAGNEDLKSSKKKGFSTFTDISDFISIRNPGYLMKTLIENSDYNFLIFKTNEEFIHVGYAEVFRVGHSKVLKRIGVTQAEFDLKIAADKMQMYWNATLLEYEGDWLKHFGLYAKAEERLIMANRADPERIGTFRTLLDIYRKLKSKENFTRVLQACKQLYKNSYCLEPYVPLMLHRGYYRKIT